MSGDELEVQADPVVRVARDLTEIVRLAGQLEEQARELARARVDGTSLPGGRAMVALTPVGSPDEWAERIAYEELWHLATCKRTEHKDCRYAEHVADGEDDVSPLQTLLFWSEQWREVHDQPLDERRPTLSTEANFIRWALDWAWDNEMHWDDFAADINQVRVRLEDVLYAGKRQDRSRVRCDRPHCEKKSLLLLVHGPLHTVGYKCRLCGQSGILSPDQDHCPNPMCWTPLAPAPILASNSAEDRWKCPSCKHRYDRDEYDDATKHQMRSEGAERFVPKLDAVATLRDQGRSPETIRKWFAPPIKWVWRDGERVAKVTNPNAVVESYCDLATHKVYVWWPDLWSLHLTTKTRQRAG